MIKKYLSRDTGKRKTLLIYNKVAGKPKMIFHDLYNKSLKKDRNSAMIRLNTRGLIVCTR